MAVESLVSVGAGNTVASRAGQQIDQNRQRIADTADEGRVSKNLVAPEEVLNKIKDLTEGGMHSVRFEMNADLEKLVISVVDKESGETIRQIPPEDLINSSVYLKELRGSLLDMKS